MPKDIIQEVISTSVGQNGFLESPHFDLCVTDQTACKEFAPLSSPYKDQPLSLTRQDSSRPYAFNYDVLRNDGQIRNSRSESADGSGRVQGSYFLTNDEGHYREVLYLADEDGFRAIIRTNEPGTKSSNPAGVVMEYSSEVQRQFQNIAQESIAPLFNSVFGSSSQSPLVNPFSGHLSPIPPKSPPSSAPSPPLINGPFPPVNQLPGFLSPKGIKSPALQRPPRINGKGSVFTASKKFAAHSPVFNKGFRPDATYSQGPLPFKVQISCQILCLLKVLIHYIKVPKEDLI
ncbi:hypothetical protein CEXT_576801 [Caerostris extrusa]|uniref:Uncharacterized protein n=1 Tax=Caerostris extrusa TaxID=172846 RepID=A0AAV4XQ49_CAEEX|nr:hypothetical protein CEXT_576801 [Caerostris extrusa]